MEADHPVVPRPIASRLTPEEEDEHAMLKLYSVDLDAAANALRMLRRYRLSDIRHCLLREATMAYCRPFSGNRGRTIKNRKHQLHADAVPGDLRPLHDDLIRRRDGLIAHTDAQARNPQVSRWPVGNGFAYFLGFAHGDWAALDKQADTMLSLIAAVTTRLHAKIRDLEAKI